MATPTNKAKREAAGPELTNTSSQLIATLGEIDQLRARLFELAEIAEGEDRELEKTDRQNVSAPSEADEYCIWMDQWRGYIFERMLNRAIYSDYSQI